MTRNDHGDVPWPSEDAPPGALAASTFFVAAGWQPLSSAKPEWRGTTSSSTSAQARACSPGRCSTPARVSSRSSGTRPSRPGSRARFGGDISVVEADALDWRRPDGAVRGRREPAVRGLGSDPEPLAPRAGHPCRRDRRVGLRRETRGDLAGDAERRVLAHVLRGRARQAPRPDRVRAAPSVDAAVLRFTRRMNPLVPTSESQRYWRFLLDAFHATPKFGAACSRRSR